MSIEGKNLWIAQSLPVPASEILKAKLALHLSVLLPAVLCDIAAVVIVFRPTGVMLVCTLLLPPIFAIFTGVLGLMANLRHPNFDWVTEVQAVKNGVSVMIALFGAWGVIIIPGVLLFTVGVIPPWALLSAYTVVIAAISFAMYRWIMTKGASIFSTL